MRLLLLLAIIFWVSLFSADTRHPGEPQNNNAILITGATIIDGTGAAPRNDDILIRGERIEAIAPKIEIPSGARVVKADGQTVLPGMFDQHTHLPYAGAGGLAGDWPKNVKAYLYCGVTSVVDFGTYPETFEPMRRLIKTGVIEAPRISLAARVTTPGGHGAEGGRGDFFSLEVSTAREARAAVRRLAPSQPDVIKVFTDGWRYGAAPDMTSMNEETLTALVDEAHQNGLEVLTHTVTVEKAKMASRAGVDVIAHGMGDLDADEEVIKLLKSKGTTYAPTLAVYEPRGRAILTPLLAATLDPAARATIQPPLEAPITADGSVEIINPANINKAPPEQLNRLRRWGVLQRNTAALRKAGVTFGVGTDAGVTGTHHGWATLRELQLLVAGGLTPLEAITAATGNAARALKVDQDRGSIIPGKLADLVIVEGEPHKNIRDIERIKRVFLGGREIDREKLAREIASPGRTSIPAIKAQEFIDDFEEGRDQAWSGRSQLDTLWVNSTDPGHDHSRMLFGRILRPPLNPMLREIGDRALSITGKMSERDRPFIRIEIPLSRGAIEPVDARAFRGVRFDVRGEGDYSLIVPTYNIRDSNFFRAPFKATTNWETISIDFSSLKQASNRSNAKWTEEDLLMLSFEAARPPDSFVWLELDNVRFYK